MKLKQLLIRFFFALVLLGSLALQSFHGLEHLEKQFVNIRAGKASPAMLGSVMVDYYGSQTPLAQVANINTPDGRTITVQPWEKGMLQEIERSIMIANLGFNPMNNGETIIISVPPLTEERRRELAKQAKSEVEEAKISIRSARKVMGSRGSSVRRRASTGGVGARVISAGRTLARGRTLVRP